MLGSQLQYLADVADLARLDFEAAAISLVTKNDKIYSRYRGSYSGGQRWLDKEKVKNLPDLNIAVSALQFKSATTRFEFEDEVDVYVEGTRLFLERGDRKIDLATRTDVEKVELEDPPGDLIAQTTVSLLLREIETASEFSARSMARPVLTGLRVVGSSDGRLAIEASDGISALYLAKFGIESSQAFEIIVPAYDTVLGLKLLGDGTVTVKRADDGKKVILVGDDAVFSSSVVLGEWPNSSKVRAEYPRQSPVSLPSSILRDLTYCVRALGTSNDLILRGDGQKLHLETVQSEMGSFKDATESDVEGTYVYDVGNFLLALNLGGAVTLHLPKENGVPTLMESSHRQYWIGQRMYSQPAADREAAPVGNV